MNDGFQEILARFDPHIRDLAVRARSMIQAVYPDVVEVPGRVKTSSATAWVRRR